MAKAKSWVFTDARKNVWIDSKFLGHEELGVSDCTVSKRALRGGLQDGVDIIEVTNGPLSFAVLPTRGMGIWRGSYQGLSLGWDAPVRGPVHPKFVRLEERKGLGWLQGFDELLVRCGLDSMGAPGEDTSLDNNGNPFTVFLTLHGRIANLPAHYVEVQADAESKTVSVIGHVDESALFCPGLRLQTTVTVAANSNRLRVADEIVNLKSTPSEMQVLYHWNFGPPFLDAGARLLAPVIEVAPRDRRAAESIKEYDAYLGPTSGYVEQVNFYDLAAPPDHQTAVALKSAVGDKAVALRFDKSQLPCFTQWKNTAALPEGYVTGLEPGTSYPNPKRHERERDRVVKIPPGKTYRCEMTLEVLSGKEQVAAVEAEIRNLQAGKSPAVHAQPIAKYFRV
ncbi:MAG: aldose 1-epimerase family protein [Planctomycetes bacterium]|nr:aldose 1-epimerase family protein [Planctomycetota bacterium]